MKTPKTINRYGLLGLLIALALNMSSLWPSINGSSEAASYNDSIKSKIESCIRNNRNNGSNNFKVTCEEKYRGKKFQITIDVEQKRRTVGKGQRSSINNDKFTIEVENESATTESSPEKLIEDIVASVTIATSTVPGCKTCEYSKDNDFYASSDFSDIQSLAGKVQNMLDVAEDDIRDMKREKSREKRIERQWKTCSTNRDGERFEDHEEFRDCIEEQLSTLEGAELARLLNSAVFPEIMNAMMTNPEVAQEYISQLAEYNDNPLVRDTLLNLSAFDRDRRTITSLRDQTLAKAQYMGNGPEAQRFIDSELQRIDALFNDYVRNTMNNERRLKPYLSQQYASIENTLITGTPPRTYLSSGFYGEGNGFDAYGAIDGGFRTSGFGVDSAHRAIQALNPNVNSNTNSYIQNGGYIRGNGQVNPSLRTARL